MSRFMITTEYKEIFEMKYQEVTDVGEEDAPVEIKSFASEQEARDWANYNNVYVSEFTKVTKLEL